ncbi:methyltransferase type 11 [Candidatus Vecturithrix granuli]|uniref:Methyltransferase type 11 n=1 Tax=Vecturithrix granuli TaxID=1499967 RepID=A0A081C002_VECG1|nr:methyltransferase type 11 [Candidatus Vecturithrix granuli]
MHTSIRFDWNIEEFDLLLDCCHRDDGVRLALQYLPKDQPILEAGCGTGRVVKFMHDLGYIIEGIELNEEIVQQVKQLYPELRLFSGDILNIPRNDHSYGGIISFGVVEHFPEGLQRPLAELYRVLKPGGIAIITVPSLNRVRQIKYVLEKYLSCLHPRKNNMIRKLFGKKQLQRNTHGFKFYVFPQFGKFFEYRLTPREFERECMKAHFNILHSIPISHIDGLYHEFGTMFCQFRNWKFYPNRAGKFLNTVLTRIAFFHNHMHALILTK